MKNLPRLNVGLVSNHKKTFFIVCLFITLLLSTAGISVGQSSTDGTTPTGLAPGGPAGSYALTGFETVNLFNGNLNFNLPLYQVRGRGGAGYTITLPIEQKWRVEQFAITPPNSQPIFTPVGEWWGGLKPGYSPGVMMGRRGAFSVWSGPEDYCGQSATQFNQLMLTRLTFTAADGTEFELRDQLTGGQPASLDDVPCESNGNSRGTVFVTADGSSATFLSDSPIHDHKFHPMGLNDEFYPSGLLILRDGTRYRIDGGLVSWMRDRNGNKLDFGYSFEKVTSITDSLGRQVTITYAGGGTSYDQITFNGFGGQSRSIKIWKASLGTVLRSGFTLKTYAQLFPNMTGASSSTEYDPERVSKVELPDGRAYQFRYNSYGELARVEMPTGGSTEYDYSSNSGEGIIYRRVSERRVYVTGSTLDNRTTYSDPGGGEVIEVRVFDASSALLAYSKHYFHGNGFASLGNPLVPDPDRSAISYPPWKEGREYQTESFDIIGGSPVLKRKVVHTFQQPLAGANWPLGQPETSNTAKSNNPQVTQSVVTLVDTNQMSKQTFTYDRYSNQTDVFEYDFGSGAVPAFATRRTQTAYLTTNPANGLDYDSANPTTSSIHIRSLPISQKVYSVNPANGSETLVAQSQTSYDESAYPILSYGSVVGWSDPGAARGAPTTIKSWLNTTGGWLERHAQFDQVGNPRKAWDEKGNLSEVEYSATFHHAYPTQTTSPIPDPTGTLGSNTSLNTSISYDFHSGLVTSTTDINNQVTSLAYNDLLDRLTTVTRPTGGGSTTYIYGDSVGDLFVREQTSLDATRVVETYKYFDGLGRPHRAYLFEGGGNYLVTDRQYDSLGRSWRVSNPYSSGTLNGSLNPSGVWTTTAYDALGRVLTVTTPDNSVVTTSYSGNSVTVNDQNGKARKSVTDALGRLIEVYEDPNGLNYQTTYLYDVLDNLVKVTQGSQQRFFMYDSLKRLIRTRNPEQGTLGSLNLSDPISGNSVWSIGYAYDANSNLTQKTDARGVVSNYVYDALNRNTTIDYSDTASINPDITRVYDTATNGKGRLRESYLGGTDSTGANVEHTKVVSYDALGRPLDQRQRFKTSSVWSSEFQTQRTYNLAGAVTSQTYPSGRTVSYGYDSAGRLLSFSGTLGDGVNRNYATELLYSPFGGLTKEKFGTDTPLYNKSFYNNRGQLSEIRLGTTYTGPTDTGWQRGAIINHYSSQCWGACSGTDNNGNLKQQDHWIPDSSGGVQGLFTQSYTYDSLNRLLRVQEGSWQQEFVYDRWGNRTIHQTNTWGTGINKKDFTANVANDNRLGVPGGQTGTMTYDNAGNLINDTYTGAGAREYDAENRMKRAWGGNNQWQEYTYNADGQRTRRKVDGVETRQVYGIEGELLAEYAASAAPSSPQKEYGYRNGQLLVTAEPAATASTNVALSANGATVTASSTLSNPPFSYPAAAVSNGDRKGIAAGYASNWHSSTSSLPQWVEVAFNGSQTIQEIGVISLQDNYSSPVEPTEATTFSLYGLTGFEVQYWTGTAWATVQGGSVSGNNKVWKKITFSPLTTTKIRVLINATSDNWSRVVEVEAWTTGAPRPNVASSANGATVSASSTGSNPPCTYPASAAINGDRKGLAACHAQSWHSSTTSLPQWVEVAFSGSQTINEISVFSLQDNYQNPVEPTEATTFSLYGLTAFEVQYWTGSAWATVPGGSVTGNNKVWKKITFSPLSTTKIRVLINATSDGWSRVVELEAWTPLSPNINWLVTDHLGTPRMIIDQTGALANVKRHDYLPFGEELEAPTGGRSAALGYAGGDGVRQQFTSKERDVETDLDYFLARYYSNVQGRFTSIDTADASLLNPQSFNKYRYGLNNPLRYIDPDGRQEKEAWYKPVLDYLRTIFGRPGFNDPESPTEPPPPPSYSPMPDKNTIIRNHFRGLVIGSQASSEVISTLDPTGATDVVGNFMQGNTKGAVIAGVLALPNLFGVNKAVLTSGEFLVGKMGKAEIGAQFRKSGDTLVADVVGTYGARDEGLGSTTRALFASIMGFAKEEGLKQVQLSGVAVINEKLEKKLIKNGWQLTKVKVGDATATAYTKTFQVE